MNVKQSCFYFICILLHVFFFSWLRLLFGITIKTFFYLTNISFFVNFTYVTLSFFKKSGILKIAKETRDNLFKFGVALAIPVNILFWGVIAYDINLLRVHARITLPHSLNFFLHGGNLIILLIDNYFITKHYNTKGISKRFLLGCSVFYSVFLHFLYHFFNIELYGLVSKLSFANYFILISIGFVCLMSGHHVHRKLIFSEERKMKQK